MGTPQEDLAALFDAERTVRGLHATLARAPREGLLVALKAATREALDHDDEDEAALRLVRLAYLLGELDGEAAVNLLIDILDGDLPEGRIAAGEALEGLSFERFKEVAMGIERALVRLESGSPALEELPFLLAEVGEPGSTKLLGRFLQHGDAEVVASAIEALAELGDPAAVPMLAKLAKDPRQVELDEEDGNGERVSIGDLAHEAQELLAELAESAQRAIAPSPRGNAPAGGRPGGRGSGRR